MRKLLFFCLLFMTFIKDIRCIQEITYYIDPVIHEAQACLKIKLSFRADNKRETKLLLPNKWGGESNFYKQIRNLKVESNITLRDTDKEAIKLLVHAPNQVITLFYEFYQNQEQKVVQYRPILKKDFMRFAGSWVLIEPENLAYNIKASFIFNNMPVNWFNITSFGKDCLQIYTGDKQALKDAFFILADSTTVRMHTLFIKNNPIYVALHGKFNFSDKEICDSLKTIINYQRDFFNDHAFPSYGISLRQSPDLNMSGGTGFYNFFDTFCSNQTALLDFQLLCLHEHFHTWNGLKISHNDDQQLFWFSEGFTEYYTLVSGFRAGILNFDQFIFNLNQMLAEYHTSPVINKPNSDIKNDFWTNPKIKRLPYLRGFVYAIFLNYKIKMATDNNYSLDDLMKDLFAHVQKTKEKFSAKLLDSLIRKYIPQGIEDDILKYITQGQTIDLHADAIVPCRNCFSIKQIGEFDLGFNFDDIKNNKVMPAVKSDSNAYKAGLREGQKVYGWSIWGDEPEKEVIIKISDKEIKYLPQKPPFKQVPFYSIKHESDIENCKSWWQK